MLLRAFSSLTILLAGVLGPSTSLAQGGGKHIVARALWVKYEQTATNVSAKMVGVDGQFRLGSGRGWGALGGSLLDGKRYSFYLEGGAYLNATEQNVYAFFRMAAEGGELPPELLQGDQGTFKDLGLAGVLTGGAGVRFHIAGPVALDVGGSYGIDVWHRTSGDTSDLDASQSLRRFGLYLGVVLSFGTR